MSQVIVPITAGQNQALTTSLPVDGNNITLTFQFTWNGQGNYWYMSVTDDNNNLIIDGHPVITGQYPAANILGQYQYLGIGSAYLVPSDGSLPDNPDFSTLGTQTVNTSESTFYLVWADSEAYTG